MRLQKPLLELIRRTSSQLPADVLKALQRGRGREKPGSTAHAVLGAMEKSVRLARRGSLPVCQDTGTPIFFVDAAAGAAQEEIVAAIKWAVRQATVLGYLRPDAVDPLSGANSGNNIGHGLPAIHYHQWGRDFLKVSLMLKGGGSENVSTQRSLPDARLAAGRDLEGVKRCVLDAVVQAQGRGCAPGVLGVAIGGDRDSGYLLAKEQLFRKLDDRNPNAQLARLEDEILEQANELGIGPMGLGGRTTLLGVKAGVLHRLPASFFVSVAYMCWACRRKTMKLYPGGEVRYA
jgi:fumarate hydratase class I